MDAIRKRLRNASLNLGPGNRKLIKGDDRREWDSLATPSDPRKFLSYLFACFQIDIILFVSFSFFSWICISFFFFFITSFSRWYFVGKFFFFRWWNDTTKFGWNWKILKMRNIWEYFFFFFSIFVLWSFKHRVSLVAGIISFR